MPEYPWIIYRMSEGPLTTKEVHQGVDEQLNRKLGTDWGYSEYEWANLLQGFRPLPIRTASGTIAHFEDGAEDVPLKSLTAQILPIQEGTGTPSPSNPRPISGTDELKLTRTGKNLFDKTNESEQINGYISASKIIADNNSLTVFTKCKPNTTYTVSKTAGNRFIVCWYEQIPNVGDTLSGQVIDQQASAITITTGATASYIVAFVFNASVDTSITRAQMLDSIQIEEGSTATTYEPYNAETYTFDLGQEIMGGTADVVGGTGSKTKAYYDFTNKNTPWDSGAPNEAGFIRFVRAIADKATGYYLLCDKFPTKIGIVPPSPTEEAISGYTSNNSIYIAISTSRLSGDLTTSAGRRQAFNDWIDANGLEICYELATPTEYTFTGQPINSYLGVNNVWTDSGEVLDVEYRSNF